MDMRDWALLIVGAIIGAIVDRAFTLLGKGSNGLVHRFRWWKRGGEPYLRWAARRDGARVHITNANQLTARDVRAEIDDGSGPPTMTSLGTARSGETLVVTLPADVPVINESLVYLHIHWKVRGRRHDAPAIAFWMTWEDREQIELGMIRTKHAMENLMYRREVQRRSIEGRNLDYLHRWHMLDDLEKADDLHWED